jgi:hypothetical protein
MGAINASTAGSERDHVVEESSRVSEGDPEGFVLFDSEVHTYDAVKMLEFSHH